IVAKTSELLPEPETPVKTVRRRFGSSRVTSLRLFSRAPCTRIVSWTSAGGEPRGWADAAAGAVLIVSMRRRLRLPAQGSLHIPGDPPAPTIPDRSSELGDEPAQHLVRRRGVGRPHGVDDGVLLVGAEVAEVRV